MPLPSGMRHRPWRTSRSPLATVTSSPSKSTWPADTSWSPARTESSVDLPAPFGPRMAVTLPGAISQVHAVDHFDALVAGVHPDGVEERARSGRRQTLPASTEPPRYAAVTSRVASGSPRASRAEEPFPPPARRPRGTRS